MSDISSAQIQRTFDLRRTNPVGLVCFVLLIVAALPVYWLGLQSLGRAWITPEYSHGPLIPLSRSIFSCASCGRRPPSTAQNLSTAGRALP